MEQNLIPIYDLAAASGEILVMLLVTFVLGALFGYLLHALAFARHALQEGGAPLLLPGESVILMQPAKDDLKVIEGIGEKIETVLYRHGILTWKMLARTPIERLERILQGAGEQLYLHNPKTWPDQAALAASGRWDELHEFKKLLNAGRDS